MYIIAGKLEGLDKIKAFYNCAVQLNSPVMRGILLERWILLVLKKKAVQMCHFIMYTDSQTIDGKTSLKVNNTLTYKNPTELIDPLLEYDHIIGIPDDPYNPGYDFLYMKFHNNTKEIYMAFYQVTVAQSHTYNMKAMNAILDAFRTSQKLNLFVVEIFFVNHSKGHNTKLGAVICEQKMEIRQQENNLYGGGDFLFCSCTIQWDSCL